MTDNAESKKPEEPKPDDKKKEETLEASAHPDRGPRINNEPLPSEPLKPRHAEQYCTDPRPDGSRRSGPS